MDMIKFIVDENPVAGAHLIHNATQGCAKMPDYNAQILIGYFANFDLAYKRVRMNWPREKVIACEECCKA